LNKLAAQGPGQAVSEAENKAIIDDLVLFTMQQAHAAASSDVQVKVIDLLKKQAEEAQTRTAAAAT